MATLLSRNSTASHAVLKVPFQLQSHTLRRVTGTTIPTTIKRGIHTKQRHINYHSPKPVIIQSDISQSFGLSFKRFNSYQSPDHHNNDNNNVPKFNAQGERIFTDDEAEHLLSKLKKIWSDSSLSEAEKQIRIDSVFDEFQMGGLVSPSTTMMINAILTDQSPDAEVAGQKMKNMHLFHDSLKKYHFQKELRARVSKSKTPPPVSKWSVSQDGASTENKGKSAKNESTENESSKKDNDTKSEEFNSSEPQKKSEENGKQEFDGIQNYVLLIVLSSLVFAYLSGGGVEEKVITFQEFQTQFLQKGFVEKLIVKDNSEVEVVLNERGKAQPGTSGNTTYSFSISSVLNFEEKLKKAQQEANMPEVMWIPVIYVQTVSIGKALFQLAPSLLLLSFLLWTTKKALSGGAGGMFGQKKKTFKKFNAEKNVKVNFADVAGCDEAKEEIMEFVKFLKNPAKYEKLGAKIPRGAILSGPPGTGKTLLAKATAGEAGVPFYSVSGSEFVEMFVGVGASRVRDLFKTARENAPSIVFVDEIDAIGKSRGKGKGMGGNDERENTLNQLLVEMDGFSTSDHVVVLAGTNRADVLDSALLRPGRFDRKIYISNPELEGRKDIFGVHLKKIRLAPSCDLDDLKGRLAALTPGMSGADIANVCNEAALTAARHNEE
ncbi:unnamed protein product [Ambrosiozyma monospora]|uniref:Unnamed protein product n=1 Tax=Ambrosiozyma monospora TaxID=43982 RepID=A0ACB5T166_AMBMO|nr:unnamed protein product [Ambrosiozyma monospora]